jgi:hypothetical protein
VTGFNWTKPDTYVQQWNVTTEYTVTNRATLDVSYIGNHALNLQRNLDVNLLDPALGRRPNPNFADINIMGDSGQSIYDGLQISYRQRLRRGLLFDANYNWSHAIDNVGDTGLSSTNPQSNDDFRAERGNGAGDIRHSVSYDLIYSLPFKLRTDGKLNKLVKAWRIAGVGIVRT